MNCEAAPKHSTTGERTRRKQSAHWLLLFQLILAGVSGGDARAETTNLSGATEITSLPITITQPGTYYLSRNWQLNLPGGNALTIAANDVIIDLNGHTIANSATPSSAVGVYAQNKSNLTVRNGTLATFGVAVNIWTGWMPISGVLIEDLRITGCRNRGVSLTANSSIVRRCRFDKLGGSTSPGSADAIFLSGGNNRVLDCDIADVKPNGTNTFASAIYLYLGDAIVERNRISSVPYGIYHDADGALSNKGKYRDNLTWNVSVPYSGGTDAGGNN